ncbi:MAG: metallophosphoesterase [Desulfovibrionaceae bacterium]|nr:metallophosphoesterase [Desulfovibrionaceae bacterium]
MLLLPSLAIVAYLVLRLVLPLPCGPGVKALSSLVLLIAGLKFTWYARLGGAFFAPGLPRPLLLVMEALYAALIILAFLTLLRDALALLLFLSRRLGTDWRLPFTPAAWSAGLSAAALILAGFGVWQSIRVPDTRSVELRVPDLPRGLDGFSLVQLSDLHIGPLLDREWLGAVVDRANALKPDVLVLTGDYIDGFAAELGDELAPLAGLRAPYGVFAVTGNHEYYYRLDEWLPVFAHLGLDMLRNEHRVLEVNGARLVIAGVPDHAEARFGGPGPDVRLAFDGAPGAPGASGEPGSPPAVRILLQHQPRGASSHQEADIQLSGHTHGGMIVFLQPLVARFNGGMVRGLYRTARSQVYMHSGTGLWNGFSCRVGVPSEITRLVLRRAGA